MEKYTREHFASLLGANGSPKLNAAANFSARLLNSPVGNNVARIVLFGSVARGEAKPDSDVDLLIIGADDLDALLERAQDIRFDMLLEGSDFISPMVYSSNDAAFPQTYFLYHSLRVGKEIYQMSGTQMRRKEAEIYETLAFEFLEAARHALAGGYLRGAVDDAYNAAELSAKGLLILRLAEIPKTHGGIARQFGKVYVLGGVAPKEMGRKLPMKLDLRHKARYDGLAKITEQDARESITFAKEMLGFLQAQLATVGEDNSEPD